MKNVVVLVLVLGGFLACKTTSTVSFHPGKKYAADQLKEELSLLRKILEENHPSLYWYTPKDSVDDFFMSTLQSITDSLPEKEYKNKIAWVLAKVKCGHTVVRHSPKYSRYFSKNRQPVFPLSVKVWPDSAVIAGNLLTNDSVLKRGTIITAINNRSMNFVVDSISSLMSADGNANNFKYQVISFNFPAYYKNAFGTDSQYIIHYIDSVGAVKTTTVKNYQPKADTAVQSIVESSKIKRKDRKALNLLNKRRMVIDTTLNAAIISINTFSEGKLPTFFRRSFRTMRKQGVQNLVLDLRQNSGGSVLSSTKLSQYLVHQPFKIADTVAAISRQFRHGRYIKPWFIYWLSMQVTGRKMQDGRIHFRYFERHHFQPKKRNHFDGHIYVLAGGYTFSAATLVTGALKGQENVTVVGEETGGGAYGNSAMHLPIIHLPITKLRVSLPMYRLVLDSKRPKNGRGIMPDVEVGPSSYLLKQGVDGKMLKVQELIRGGKL